MILPFSLLFFAFFLFLFAKDDFVLLRRSITLQHVFDAGFIIGTIGFVFSRIGYVALHPSVAFLNPLVFLVIPYFPGLSISGFMLGSLLGLFLYGAWKKLPLGRLSDIFVLSFLCSSAVYFLMLGIQLLIKHTYLVAIGDVVSSILMLLFFLFLRAIFYKAVWKDGAISVWGMVVVSVILFLNELLQEAFHAIPKEGIGFVLVLLVLLVVVMLRRLRKEKNA